MLEVAEQRPMNEYVNSWIIKLSLMTLAGIFKLYSKFLSTLQTRNHEVNRQIFYKFYTMPTFLLSGKSNYVVEKFSVNASMLLSRGTITSPPKVRGVSGDSLPILHRRYSDPIPRLETV